MMIILTFLALFFLSCIAIGMVIGVIKGAADVVEVWSSPESKND